MTAALDDGFAEWESLSKFSNTAVTRPVLLRMRAVEDPMQLVANWLVDPIMLLRTMCGISEPLPAPPRQRTVVGLGPTR